MGATEGFIVGINVGAKVGDVGMSVGVVGMTVGDVVGDVGSGVGLGVPSCALAVTMKMEMSRYDAMYMVTMILRFEKLATTVTM